MNSEGILGNKNMGKKLSQLNKIVGVSKLCCTRMHRQESEADVIAPRYVYEHLCVWERPNEQDFQSVWDSGHTTWSVSNIDVYISANYLRLLPLNCEKETFLGHDSPEQF